MSKISSSFSITFKLLIQTVFIFIKIKSEITECPRETPILISNNCYMQYCDKNNISSEQCIIKNEIVKTQWLNNIIIIGDIYFRYINFGIYSNGDMVIGTTVYPGNTARKFYGIKNNGRPLFQKDSKETPHKLIYIPEDTNGNFESESLIIKTTPDGQEYFLWVSKLENYAEMFNFDNGNIYKSSSADFGGVTLVSMRHALIPITTEDNNYYYIFGFIGNDPSSGNFIFFKKYQFQITPISFFLYYSPIIKYYPFGNMVSCFETKNKLIICFYMTKTPKLIFPPNNYVDVIELNLIKFDNNLSGEETYPIVITLDDTNNFYKCVHLKDEVGVFAYYNYYSSTNVIKPFLLFMEYNDNQFKNYLPDTIPNSLIALNPTDLTNNFLLNDIITINENKICFSSILSDKETIYIIILNIFDDRKIKIRYYSIPSFILYHFKILFELRIQTYKNYISFSSSFCPNEACYTDDDEHYSSLIIFSYPNGTDFTLDIEKYLLNNNNISINNLIFDLHEYIIIENNIFGNIYKKILIQNISGYENLKLFSSINSNEEIEINKTFEENEKILLNASKTENDYGLIKCKLEYVYIITAPELNIYDTYPNLKELDDDTGYFTKEEYIGRLTYYFIELNNILSTSCDDDDCLLCLKNPNTYCITCKYNFTISLDNNNQYYKTCIHEGETTETTETTETAETAETTEITETEETTEITEKKTELTTNKIAESNNIKDNNECTIDEIINNLCTEGEMGQNQFGPIYDILKKIYMNNNIAGKNIIIQTKNVLFQISSHEDQKKYNNPNISNIDLAECEDKLKSGLNNPENKDLIILKTDIKSKDLTQTYVQYEIYDPIEYKQLDLSLCNDIKISINAPVKLDNATSNLYDNLQKSGYNLFQETGSFYTDICSIYTSENGTDMILEDRKKDIFENNGNITLCQNGCQFLSYNSSQEKAECECTTKIESIRNLSVYSDKQFDFRNISEIFFSTIKNSNFLVMKCYKLAFDFTTFSKNIGRIFMSIVILLNFILLIIFCFIDFKNINKYLLSILNVKMHFIKNFSRKKGKKKSAKSINKNRLKQKKNNNEKIIDLEEDIKNEESKIQSPPKKSKKRSFVSRNDRNIIFSDNLSKKNDQNLSIKSLLGDDYLSINKKLSENKKEVNINIIPINNFNYSQNRNNENMEIKDENTKIVIEEEKKDINKDKNEIKESKNEYKENKIEINKEKNEMKDDKKEVKKEQNEYKENKNEINKEKNEIKEDKNEFKEDKIVIKEESKEIKEEINNETGEEKNEIKNEIDDKEVIIPGKTTKITKKRSKSFTTKKKKKKNVQEKRDYIKKNLTDQELNTLEYELAIRLDKRNYFQFYWSLLKRKNLILFTFFPSDDYNLITIKISLFLISFSLYMTFNGFFFTDETMHNIHKNNGIYKIIIQIPQIMYSSMVCAVINIILKHLSLSEKNLIKIKREKERQKLDEKTKIVIKNLKIKFFIYFLIGFVLLFFFWYFISCFCAVYTNTQIILIKDSLISFGISMLYPFALNLFAGIFRIPALRAPKKDKKVLYQISCVLALI